MASQREHQVLDQVLRDLRTQKEISRTNWQRLRDVFGSRFDNAWRLVTENRVKKYIFSPSNRTIWVAIGNNAEYMIYSNAEYCSCSDFYFRVLDEEKAYCYHLLAQKIAETLDHFDLIQEDDEAYDQLNSIWKRYSVQD